MYVGNLSATKIKTYDGKLACTFKYFLSYEAKICKACDALTCVSQLEKRGLNCCPSCGSQELERPNLGTNFAAQTGSLVHKVLELYAEDRKNGKIRKWREDLVFGFAGKLKGAEAPDLKLAKAKDFADVLPVCTTCEFALKNICSLSNEKLKALTGCSREVFYKTEKMIEYVIQKYDNVFSKNILGLEQKFNIEIIPGVCITGYIDVILKEDAKTILVVDYKTGSSTMGYDEQKRDIQSKIYYLACRKLYPDFPFVNLVFEYFQGSPVELTYSDKEIGSIEKYLIDFFNRVKKQTKLIRRKQDFVCNHMCNRGICDTLWAKLQSR